MLARRAIAAMAPGPSNSGTAGGGAEGGAFGVIMKYPAWACSIIAQQNRNACAPIVSFFVMETSPTQHRSSPRLIVLARGVAPSMMERCLAR
jgi:hypothetical protein